MKIRDSSSREATHDQFRFKFPTNNSSRETEKINFINVIREGREMLDLDFFSSLKSFHANLLGLEKVMRERACLSGNRLNFRLIKQKI
jgi:hypothetical protein